MHYSLYSKYVGSTYLIYKCRNGFIQRNHLYLLSFCLLGRQSLSTYSSANANLSDCHFVDTLRGESPSLHKNVFILIFNWHNCDEDYEHVNMMISNEHFFFGEVATIVLWNWLRWSCSKFLYTLHIAVNFTFILYLSFITLLCSWMLSRSIRVSWAYITITNRLNDGKLR